MDVVEPASPSRRRLVGVLRIVVGIIVAVVLVSRLSKAAENDALPDLTGMTIVWLVGALLFTAAGLVMSAVRWQLVLRLLEVDADLGRLLNHYAAGQFVGNLLPTTVGGDVLRITRLGRDTDDTPTSFASVVLERLTGWLVLPAFIIGGMLINPGLAQLGTASAVAIVIAFMTIGVLVVLLWAAEHPRFGGRALGNSRWRQLLGAVHFGVVSLRRHPREVIAVLLSAAAYQAMLIIAAFMAARAVGIDLGPTAFVAFIPAVLIAQVLPLSISGLGLREGALILFLHPLGVSDAQSIVLGLLLYALNLVVSLAGAPSFAFGGRSRDRRATAVP